MLSDLQLPNHDGSPIRGNFRLTRYSERMLDGGVQGVLTLEDASGRLDHVIVDEDPSPIRAFRCPGLVRGRIQPVTDDVLTTAIVLSMEEVDVEDIENGAALLPRAESSEAALPALGTVIAFNQSIANADLKAFLTRVLLDDVIAYPLMTYSAGVTSAHDYEGGLLAHGADWLDEAGRLAVLAFPESRYGTSAGDWVTVTQLVHLFHDLYRTLVSDKDANVSARYLGKRMLNLLKPQLDWLAQRNESFARHVRMLLMPKDEEDEHDEPGRNSAALAMARNIIRRCDEQRELRDQSRNWARAQGEPAATDAGGKTTVSPSRLCDV